MNSVSDPTVSEVVVMSASNFLKLNCLLNVIGYHVDHDLLRFYASNQLWKWQRLSVKTVSQICCAILHRFAGKSPIHDHEIRETQLSIKFSQAVTSRSSVRTQLQAWQAVRSELSLWMSSIDALVQRVRKVIRSHWLAEEARLFGIGKSFRFQVQL